MSANVSEIFIVQLDFIPALQGCRTKYWRQNIIGTAVYLSTQNIVIFCLTIFLQNYILVILYFRQTILWSYFILSAYILT